MFVIKFSDKYEFIHDDYVVVFTEDYEKTAPKNS